MTESSESPRLSTLSTKLEEDFVAPLTAIRGALEILRDFPDISAEERARFVHTALSACGELERGVDDLGASVYAAARREQSATAGASAGASEEEVARRVRIHEALGIVEVDFSGMEFTSSRVVNSFYDGLDALVRRTGRKWYFLVNYQDVSVWPEAWVSFAHRGKKVNVSYSLGTVRYLDPEKAGSDALAGAAGAVASRELGLKRIEEMRRSAAATGGRQRR